MGCTVCAEASGFSAPSIVTATGCGGGCPRFPVWLLIVCFALAHLARFEIQWTLATVKALPFVVLRGCGAVR